MTAKTLFEKLWDKHVVCETEDGLTMLYVDRHLVYEVTSPQAFEGLRVTGRNLWRADSVLATVDHNVPTTLLERRPGAVIRDKLSRLQVDQLKRNCEDFGVTHFDLDDPRQGIIHVVGPEQGATLPGMTVVAGDSHTSTHGAFAALAFGIGTSDVEHTLATQCLILSKMKSALVRIEGEMLNGVTAKDLILAVIEKVGSDGGNGYAIEFSGSTVRSLSMEARMTLCNMAIEAGARVGLVGVDQQTIDYLQGRPMVPIGDQWTPAVQYWRTLISDQGAQFDWVLDIDSRDIRPMVTWGTTSEMVTHIQGKVPYPKDCVDPLKRASLERALAYMGLKPGTPMMEIRPSKIFIGSCTNARIEDLRAAASVLKGKRIASSIRQALVVPGSGLVKTMSEEEGLDVIFKNAGFEWRAPGCSMCLGMNDDRLEPGERCASTSNRNFEGRQGSGGRTHLVSPAMAAAAAIAGHFVDITELIA